MSSPTKVLAYEDVLKRVRSIQKTAAAQGDKVTDVKDVTDTGTVTPPTHPSEATTNSQLPGGNPLTTPQGKPAPTLEGKQAEGTLEKATPETVNGVAQDAKVDTSTAKIASDAKAIAERVRGMLKPAAEKKAGDFDVKKKEDVGAGGEVPKSKTDAADPTDKGAVAPSDKRGPADIPAKGNVNTAPDNSAKEKAAAAEAVASDITLDQASYVKLASVILESEEGVKLATRLLKEAKGAEVANQLINAATQAQENFNKAAAAEAQGAELADAMFKSASAEDQALIIKYAQVHSASAEEIDADTTLTAEQKQIAKLAYAQGAMDGAAMQDASAEGGAGNLPGGESEEPSPEDILAIVEQLVQSGQLPPEVGQQLIQELTGGGEGAAAPAGAEGAAPAGAEGAAAPAVEGGAEAAPADEAAKAAGAHLKSASAEQKLAAELIRAMIA
jgi:hypothetical protein